MEFDVSVPVAFECLATFILVFNCGGWAETNLESSEERDPKSDSVASPILRRFDAGSIESDTSHLQQYESPENACVVSVVECNRPPPPSCVKLSRE
jgi:hypothetical protein